MRLKFYLDEDSADTGLVHALRARGFDVAQALAKIERGHTRDLADVAAMLERRLIDRRRLWQLFESIAPELLRYPGIEPAAFRASVLAICRPSPSV